MQIVNRTPFSPAVAVVPGHDGGERLHVLIKSTFRIGSKLEPADLQEAPAFADLHHGDPATTSIRIPSDLHMEKSATDIGLVGSAWAPDGRPVTQLDVLFRVADRQKILRVSGNRAWHVGLLSLSAGKPEPFTQIPLTYENAYGGFHVTADGKMRAEERNPVGRGFRGKRSAKEMAVLPLPHIEDPLSLLKTAGDRQVPQGFGFIAPGWLPRRALAGTYDQAWTQTRAPFLPNDFQERFSQAAHQDLIAAGHLRGGEPVEILNATQRRALAFGLPGCNYDIRVTIAGSTVAAPPTLQTVRVEPDHDRLVLTHLAVFDCDKKLMQVERIDLTLKTLVVGEVKTG